MTQCHSPMFYVHYTTSPCSTTASAILKEFSLNRKVFNALERTKYFKEAKYNKSQK